ncbi:MAG: dephospho-CoA kinase [Cytophagales bacterium]|nr:dephospho-CoA kinase [Bernardetiaceae bacterium]MDW8204520.1 dephospho-CoA kinase [Cytophagales bacterium]
MLKVGVTGGIGSGKSTVCRIFMVLGIPVYDADSRAKWLQTHDPLLKSQIIQHFGAHAYLPDGSLNRTYLAEQVFSHAERLQLLNSLVHPRVAEDSAQWLALQQAAGKPYAIKEAALMIESGSYKQLDLLIVVTAPEEVRIQRILQRDPQRSREQITAIISKQMPENEKIKFADFVICNDGNQMLIPQVMNVHQQLIHATKPLR